MRKKEIEKIPYLGLKKINRKKDVKYIGVTAVKIVGNKKHLFLEVYKNKKESKMVPVVRIILTEKEFWNYFPKTEQRNRQRNVRQIQIMLTERLRSSKRKRNSLNSR